MERAVSTIHPFILSGGSGTRLWPLSRGSYPKQFQPLAGSEASLLQQSCLRVNASVFAHCSVLCNNEHRFLVAEQLQQAGIEDATIVLEPVGRNTAPAALISALMVADRDPEALVLLMPSDHVIADTKGFQSSVKKGVDAATGGRIVTFGVKPDKPETGYGYIEVGDVHNSVHAVSRFIEKPPKAKAEAYLQAGNFLWNAGIFLYSARVMIAAFEAFAPETLRHCRAALELAKADLDFLRLDKAAYAQCENLSIDYAIIEKVDAVACVPLESDWSDLGSWHALWEIGTKDADGNVAQGDVLLHDTHNSYIQGPDGVCMSLVGMEGIIAVATHDAILLAPKDRAQDVKHIVDKLKQAGRAEAELHKRVHRPWGWYEQRGQGARFQVKYLMVKPGAKLSLQSHHHRAEHWVVVSGTAEVTVDDKTFLMTENESTYIPLGATHRLANPGKLPALLIEIQSGAYLGEDDIVRYEDDFNRDKEGP